MPSEEELFRQAGEPPAAAPPPEPADDRRLIPDREDQRALSEGIEGLHRRPLTSVPTVKPPGVGEPKPPGELERIPLPAYLEERERRQRLEREVEELKGKVTPPKAYDPAEEMFSDPQGYTQRITTTLTQQFEQRQALAELNFDLRLAELRHGDEWKEAWDSYMKHVGELDERTGKGKHPMDYQRVMNASSPGEEIMAWHRERKYRDEVGNDPAAYRERIRQEILEEMNGGDYPAPASQAGHPNDRPHASDGKFQTTRRLPTSLSKAPGGSAAHGDETSLDGSDASLWKATASRQRPRRQ